MKASNKILWAAIIGLFGCIVAFLIFLRVVTSPMIERVEPSPGITHSKQVVYESDPLSAAGVPKCSHTGCMLRFMDNAFDSCQKVSGAHVCMHV